MSDTSEQLTARVRENPHKLTLLVLGTLLFAGGLVVNDVVAAFVGVAMAGLAVGQLLRYGLPA